MSTPAQLVLRISSSMWVKLPCSSRVIMPQTKHWEASMRLSWGKPTSTQCLDPLQADEGPAYPPCLCGSDAKSCWGGVWAHFSGLPSPWDPGAFWYKFYCSWFLIQDGLFIIFNNNFIIFKVLTEFQLYVRFYYSFFLFFFQQNNYKIFCIGNFVICQFILLLILLSSF